MYIITDLTMKTNDLQRRCTEITKCIDTGRLTDAMTRLRALSEGLMAYEVSDEIDRVSDTYNYMLKYAMLGAADPQRPRMYADIVDRLLTIMDILTDKALTVETPTLYYNVKRYERTQPGDSVTALLTRYRHELSRTSVFGTAGAKADPLGVAQAAEALEKRLFNRLWVTNPLSDADVQQLYDAMTDSVIPAHTRRLLLSALTLGLMQYYDERRLLLLLDAYAQAGDDTDMAMTAMAGALIGMFIHNARVSRSEAVAARTAAMRDETSWSADVPMMFMEFIRTRDIERIDKTFREDIIPTISKITPDLKRSISKIDPENADAELNPEWADMLDKSGISAKLRELSEMQEQGSDVMMSAFASMKSFTFFNDISNWFLPFHEGHSNYINLNDELRGALRMFSTAMNLCDSDSYSLLLSLTQVPGKQLDMLRKAQGMGGDMEEMLEQVRNAREHTAQSERREAANRCVRDMYRFFKLFRRKGEFRDPFDGKLNLLTVDILCPDFGDIETIKVVAEFYFAHQQWSDALAVMRLLDDRGEISAQLYQKMGYCCQQMNEYSGALEYYHRAELLDAASIWLIRRIARCYRLIGQHERATHYYKKLDEAQPDEFGTTMALGTLSIEVGEYERALQYLHKAEFINEKSHKPWRPIAWAALMTGDLDKAARYYGRIEADSPDGTDILNMGHLCLIRGDVAGAVSRYRTSATVSGNGIERLVKQINGDHEALIRLGVPDDLLTLLPDLIAMNQ